MVIKAIYKDIPSRSFQSEQLSTKIKCTSHYFFCTYNLQLQLLFFNFIHFSIFKMNVFNTILYLRCFFITKLSLGVWLVCCILPNPVLGQLVIADQSYQSNIIEGSVGNWDDAASWQVWQAGAWEAATVPPNRSNDVFIHQNQEIRITGNQEVRNLYLFSAANPGRKLNLQTFDLDIYGSLNAFEILEGDFFLHSSAHPSMNWIYPITGSLVFKGLSRTVVDRNSWSGQTFNSNYIVRFNPDPGEILTVNAAFKASQFIIESGTVFQTVNENGAAASSTFSFNSHSDLGDGAYGSLIIRSSARLISAATREFGQLIRRTGTRPAAEFILEEGAILELWGDEPLIDAASVILDGEVHFQSNSLSQQFLSHTFSTSQPIIAYHDLYITGSAIRPLPSVLEVSGDFIASDGTLQNNATSLSFLGSDDQIVDVTILPVSNLEVNKTEGILTFIQALQIPEDFVMKNGMVNFNHQALQINSSATANYTYINGSWANLSEITLVHLPIDWTPDNATFPFFDSFAGENRTLRLLGTLPVHAGTLSIQHIELQGVNFSADLTDSDGETIYYHQNSHFRINTSNMSTEPMEIQILANDMILDDIADLRISGYGQIAPGVHLSAIWQDGNLWGKRGASLSEINSQTLTLASSGILSVLPLGWISYDAKFIDDRVRVSWKVKAESGTTFIIYRSLGTSMLFSSIGSVESASPSTAYQSYNFTDDYRYDMSSEWVYYQIRAEIDGIPVDESPVFRLKSPKLSIEGIQIFPNPYQGGILNLHFGEFLLESGLFIQVFTSQGQWVMEEFFSQKGQSDRFLELLKKMKPGVYILHFQKEGEHTVIKWIKENQ